MNLKEIKAHLEWVYGRLMSEESIARALLGSGEAYVEMIVGKGCRDPLEWVLKPTKAKITLEANPHNDHYSLDVEVMEQGEAKNDLWFFEINGDEVTLKLVLGGIYDSDGKNIATTLLATGIEAVEKLAWVCENAELQPRWSPYTGEGVKS